MKPVLMIHEMSSALLSLPLEDYTLTFDDGLYSQYLFWEEIRKINTTKLFFISTAIVCNGQQNKTFISSKLAHEKARMGIFEDFMTLEQIQELAADSQVIIGGHSHSHTRLNNFANLYEKSEYIKQDTAQMITWFDKNLRTFPEHFCFPYNEDLDSLYQGLAKKQGIKYFYGNERIPVETLLRSQNLPENLDTLSAWSLPRHF
jgi:hypothetical protein